MKKTIAIFIAALLMSFCLSFTVSGADAAFTVSEDYQTVTYDGTTYHRMDLSAVSIDDYGSVEEEPLLTSQQQAQLRDCSFRTDFSKTVIEADFFFRDGSILNCSFVSEDYRQQFLDEMTRDETECYIEFYWNEYLRTKAPESHFKGTPTTLKGWNLQNAEAYPVYVNNGFGGFTVIKGTLLVVNNRFYYVCHLEEEIYTWYCVDTYEYDALDCYEITDPALLADIEKAMGAYYSMTYGAGNLLNIATIVFWTFIFVVIPVSIVVLAIIFFKRGKGYYRTVWSITGICAVLELVLFITVCVTLLLSV